MNQTTQLSDVARSRSGMFFIAAFLIGQAVQINNGNLHPISLCAIALALGILAVAIFRTTPARAISLVGQAGDVAGIARLVSVLIAVQWVELLFWGLTSLPGSAAIGWFMASMLVAGCGAVLMLGIPRIPRARTAGLAILVVGHLLAGSYVIRAVPHPGEDLWSFEQASTAALLHGENPYGVRYRNPYDPDTTFFGPGVVVDGWLTYSYPYPPLMAILSSAGRAFGDVRWAHLIALELAAVLIAETCGGDRGSWAAAMFLTMPYGLRIIAGGWSEPIVILMFAATLFCALRARRWLWLTIGLLLAIKQYTVLIAPLTLLLLEERANWKSLARMLAKACAVTAAVTLPIAAWDFRAFFRSTVLFQFRQPFRVDSLSFNAMLKVMTGIEVGPAIGFVLAGAALIWGLRRAPRTAAGFAGASALLLLAFFAFNKQAFGNYYFLVFAITSFAAALTAADPAIAVETAPHVQFHRQAA